MRINELSYQECIDFASNPDTSSQLLTKLVYHRNPKISNIAVSNPSTPYEVLVFALKNPRASMRAAAVGNLVLPLNDAERFVDDEDVDVVRALAGRHDLSPELMWKLASHPSFEVAQGVGRRSSLPVEVGVMLAVGREMLNLETVRPEAVGNDLFPFKTFGLWLKDKNESLLHAKAGELPLELVLEWFAEQGDKILVNNYYVKYVEHTLVPNIRVYIEAETGITGLPDAWVVRMFRTLVGEF